MAHSTANAGKAPIGRLRKEADLPARHEFQHVLVWDAPTRVVQGLMLACLAGAFATAGENGSPLLHASFGWTLAGLAAFRILWGFIGTRHARFASFVKGPKAVARSLRDLPRGWATRHVGHSPAAAVAVVTWLLTLLLVCATGAGLGLDAAPAWLQPLHEGAAYTAIVLAGLQLAGSVFGCWRAGESPLQALMRGTKPGSPQEAIPDACRGVAWLVVAAVLGYWCYRWVGVDDVPVLRAPMAAAQPGSSR
ncbi:cytochrome b/b6 domain-containing protein [Variovorax sp. KK3]|uniref:cytochrome b/b6 domain-containing protein n=1 Tax=Variovorax sp. KK3 TaxID=1855728 RepID=UPI00097C5179|nr:cytochrome b/b6 domain-containing protein [Variovorax sp. KK3]